MRRTKFIPLLFSIVVVFFSFQVFAFLELRDEDGKLIKWYLNDLDNNTVFYYVNENGTEDELSGKDEFSLIQEGFNRWTTNLGTVIRAVMDGTTSNSDYGCGTNPLKCEPDGVNLILFVKQDKELSDALAMTINIYSTVDGVMKETDIVFNEDYIWASDPALCEADSTKIYLPAVISHEAGHFFGLDHSFSAYYGDEFDEENSATMFPFYFGPDEETLEHDDIAGIVYLYPDPGFKEWGHISGKIYYEDKRTLFGIHIVALDAITKRSYLSHLSEKDGSYILFGLEPGYYYLYIESPSFGPYFFTEFFSEFYSASDAVNQPLLYPDIFIDEYSQLVDGNPVFNEAMKLAVNANDTTTGVDFIVPLERDRKEKIEPRYDFEGSPPRWCGAIEEANSLGSEFNLLFSVAFVLFFFILLKISVILASK